MQIDILNVAAKPIPSQVPAFTEAGGQATWPSSTATLISGDTEALLVDALMTQAEGRQLAGWVSQHRRPLRAVYITHPHADHLFGIGPVLREHPGARPVTLSGMVPAMREQASDAWVQVWEGFFPGQIEAPGTLPEPLDGDSLDIDGAPIRFEKLADGMPVGGLQAAGNNTTEVALCSLRGGRQRLIRHFRTAAPDRGPMPFGTSLKSDN